MIIQSTDPHSPFVLIRMPIDRNQFPGLWADMTSALPADPQESTGSEDDDEALEDGEISMRADGWLSLPALGRA